MYQDLILKASAKTAFVHVVCQSRLLHMFANLFTNVSVEEGNSVNPDQTAPLGAV